MIFALQFVNRPEDVEAIYKTVVMDSMNLQNCRDCIFRIYVKAYADIELKNYNSAIKIIETAQKENEIKYLNRPLLIAYIRSGKQEVLQQLLRKIDIIATPAEAQELYLQAGKEYLLKGNRPKADEYFNKIINSEPDTVTPEMLADALFYKENYAKAEKVLSEIHTKDPKNSTVLSKLAICNFKLGSISEAEKNIQNLENLHANFQFGEIDYALAQYYAATKNKAELYKSLLKSVASGHMYHWKYYKNDPQFIDYINSKEFEEVLNFWK